MAQDILSAVELRKRKVADLESMVESHRRELARLRVEVARGEIKKVSDVGTKKRMVARMLTVLREVTLKGNKG